MSLRLRLTMPLSVLGVAALLSLAACVDSDEVWIGLDNDSGHPIRQARFEFEGGSIDFGSLNGDRGFFEPVTFYRADVQQGSRIVLTYVDGTGVSRTNEYETEYGPEWKGDGLATIEKFGEVVWKSDLRPDQ